MMVATIAGILGILATFILGYSKTDLSTREIFIALLGANLGGLIALTVTLQIEKIRWARKYLINRSMKTWALLVIVYCIVLFGVSSGLRNPSHFLWLMVPLLVSQGWMVQWVFGPIQDRIVGLEQKNRATKKKANPESHQLKYMQYVCEMKEE